MRMERNRVENDELDFWGHVAALRPHLVRSVLAVVLAGVAAFLCKEWVIDRVLFGPRSAGFPTNRLLLAFGEGLQSFCGWLEAQTGWPLGVDAAAFDTANLDFRFINTSLAGQFNLHMKISLLTGLAVAMPYVLWEFWRFVRPALTPRETAAAHRFVLWVSLLFFAGLLFGYFIIVPLSVAFFINYEASPSIVNMIEAGQYLSMVAGVSLGSALLFQLPLLVHFLARMGLVTADLLRRYRRHAFVGLLVVAAVITPPDLFSLLLVVVPLCWLYELSIRIVARVEAKERS
ncbi:MAG: twin-arginine translocase subunit TatC [Alistipes sp.]|nr:twin-arginine translocase subunit TatC [Alistipes sp.]